MLKNILRQIKLDKEILSIIVGSKIAIFLVIFLAYNLLPFAKNYYYANFIYPPNEKISLQSAFKTWDAQHFLYLSEVGYRDKETSITHFPLYPMLIKEFTLLFKDSFVVGLIIANLFSFFGYYFLYKFVLENFHDSKVAFTTLILFLVFPTHFYFSLVYSESIFFFFVISFFYYLFKKNYLLASLLSFFLPLTRAVGILVFFPFLLYYLKQYVKFHPRFSMKIHVSILLLFFPILGYFAYFWFMYTHTGNAFSGYETMSYYIARPSLNNILHPQIFLTQLFTPNITLHAFTSSILDRIFFLLFIFILPLIYKKTGIVLFIFSAVLGMVPLLGTFMSYMRYINIIFPIFIALSFVFQKKKYSFLEMPYVFLSISLGVFFLIMHALNYWVA